MQAVTFLLLNTILRFSIDVGLSKQAATSAFMSVSSSWIQWIAPGHPVWGYMSEIVPIVALILLSWLLYRTISRSYCHVIWKYIVMGTILSYILIAIHWLSESNISSLAMLLPGIGKSHMPRIVYVIGLGQLLVAFCQLFAQKKTLDGKSSLMMKTVAMLSAWSSTVIVLSGKQGSVVALASVIGGAAFLL